MRKAALILPEKLVSFCTFELQTEETEGNLCNTQLWDYFRMPKQSAPWLSLFLGGSLTCGDQVEVASASVSAFCSCFAPACLTLIFYQLPESQIKETCTFGHDTVMGFIAEQLNNRYQAPKRKRKKREREKENEYHQNLTDGAKEVLRGTFITINVYIKKKERSQISNLIRNQKNKNIPSPKLI